MTNAEAAALLGVPESTTPDQVRRRYEELHNDFQIRLTNAPTAVLKKTYQKNLQELQQAAELLAPGSGVSMLPDLPSAEPLHAGVGAALPRPASRTARERGSEPDADAGLPRSTMVVGTIAALLAGVCAFLGIVIMNRSSAQARTAAELANTQAYLKSYAGLEYADPLRVRNVSQRPVVITALSVTYLDGDTGTLKSVHSANYGYHTWTIDPNDVVAVDKDIGRGRDWTGRVVFYSMLVDHPDVEPYLKSGAWARDIDDERTLPLKLD